MRLEIQNRIIFWANVFLSLTLVWTISAFYNVKEESRRLHVAYEQSLERDVQIAETFFGALERSNFEREIQVEGILTVLGQQSEQINVIEESLDPAHTRWAKIKRVRFAVKDVIEQKGYGSLTTVEVTSYAAAVVDFSEKYDVPASLILAMTERESAFKIKAHSSAGALGLMQVMPTTAQEISADLGIRHYNLFKIRDNVHFGSYYIMKMMDEFGGDVGLAVRAYNCGPTYVQKVVGGEYSDYPQETRLYVLRILGDKDVDGFVKYYENEGL